MSIILPSYQFMISIHALREEGDKRSSVLDQSAPVISIHALREEGDVYKNYLRAISAPISIHALREEGDSPCAIWCSGMDLFLSTPSARRATQSHMLRCCLANDFYPRPPRGGRRLFLDIPGQAILFLSTPSARRATWASTSRTSRRGYFYPRPPRGGRPLLLTSHLLWCEFLSTPSARRATHEGWQPEHRRADFYPRPPRGGRHPKLVPNKRIKSISIHALREEGDRATAHSLTHTKQFLSTPSARRATPA